MDVLCIVGPTAVGKTKLSLALAEIFDGEIISGDAYQFYQGMDIGTAKATKEEQAKAKHHLLDILAPSDEFSVVDYQALVRKTIHEIQARGHLPILVGGSGLYIQSVIENYQFKGKKSLHDESLAKLSLEDLQTMLKKKNPTMYDHVDLKNKRRVIRAIEKEDKDLQIKRDAYYDDVCLIGLNTERQNLYQRINQRVYDMIDKGLVEEVKTLYDKGVDGQAIKAIGYKEIYQYLDGDISLDDAVQLIQKHSRHYAKRQLTWFRNRLNVQWFDVNFSDFKSTIDDVKNHIKKVHQV